MSNAPAGFDGGREPAPRTVYEVPVNLSPSRVEAFTTCPLAFRLASIDRLPELPSVHTTKGSFVHRVLELLYLRAAPERDRAAADQAFEQALDEYREHPDLTGLGLGATEQDALFAECRTLVDNYFEMEDPRHVRAVGLELYLSAPVGELTLRGIIDRLDLDAEGGLIVTDYKTGRAPSASYEQGRLGGVHFYSFLCEAVFGVRPSAIRLMYLRNREVITAIPSERSVRFVTQRTHAVWKAIERACVTGDFRPRPSLLCQSCAYQQWCPAFGGDPERAKDEFAAAWGIG